MVYETYEEAADAREYPDDEMVCGVRMPDESARYFVMPVDAPDQVIHDRAFQIRNGRPVSDYERLLKDLAERLNPVEA